MKTIDLNRSVAELIKENPELEKILADIGFEKILNPTALKAMGNIMNLPRGAAIKSIPMENILAELARHGFSVTGYVDKEARKEKLRGYIERLSQGEALESVREEFVREFASVSAMEIAEAEQQLIKEGMPLEEVQKLCDVHSALFHGRTESEVIKKKMETQAANMEDLDGNDLPEGHPIRLLRAENAGLEQVLDTLQKQCESEQPDAATVAEALLALNGVRSHYAKKEELLMPLLYAYGVTGPSQVMWDVDDEIKKELGILVRVTKEDADNVAVYKGRIAALVKCTREMIYKEERILFPLCIRFFTEEEWLRVYRDFPEMGIALVDKPEKWEKGEQWAAAEQTKISEQEILGGKVQLPTGELTVGQLRMMLSLLPVDITFIDENDVLRFFVNEGNVFPRPKAALGRAVYECHPPQVVPAVRNLIADFRAKKRSSMEVARYIMGKPILVKYMAVYGDDGSYRGALEVVQDCSHILGKFQQC